MKAVSLAFVVMMGVGCVREVPRPVVAPVQVPTPVVRPQINVAPATPVKCDSIDLLKQQADASRKEAAQWRAYAAKLEQLLSLQKPASQ